MSEKKYFVIGLRKIKSEEEYKNRVGHNIRTRKYKNRININTEKSKDNIVLEPLKYRTAKELIEFGNNNLKGKARKLKKNSAFCFEIVVDCSVMDGWKEEDYVRYLKDAYEFIKDRFKGQDIINATIHVDESKPHLHVIVSYFNKELGKWNQRGLNQQGLTKLHNLLKDFQEQVGSKYGLVKGDGKKLERIKKELAKQVKEIQVEKRKFLFKEKETYKVLPPRAVLNVIRRDRELLQAVDIRDLQDKLAQVKQQNERLKEKVEELQVENKDLKTISKKLEQENKTLKEQNNKFRDIINKLANELVETKAKIAKDFNRAKQIIKNKLKRDLGINF